MFAPSRVWRKKTGPVGLTADPDRGEEEERGGDEQQDQRPGNVDHALGRSDVVESRAGGTVSRGRPSIRWTSARGPTSS